MIIEGADGGRLSAHYAEKSTFFKENHSRNWHILPSVANFGFQFLEAIPKSEKVQNKLEIQ